MSQMYMKPSFSRLSFLRVSLIITESSIHGQNTTSLYSAKGGVKNCLKTLLLTILLKTSNRCIARLLHLHPFKLQKAPTLTGTYLSTTHRPLGTLEVGGGSVHVWHGQFKTKVGRLTDANDSAVCPRSTGRNSTKAASSHEMKG
jgi:hypothetical protein